jgi:hypothetical protein
VHRVQVRTEQGEWQTVQEFSGVTEDTSPLFFSPAIPLQSIRFVRIETVQGPSWVGWHEIRIFGKYAP